MAGRPGARPPAVLDAVRDPVDADGGARARVAGEAHLVAAMHGQRHAPQRVAVEDVEVEPVAVVERQRAQREEAAQRIARDARQQMAHLVLLLGRPEVHVGDARRHVGVLIRRSRTPLSVSATLIGRSVLVSKTSL